ncbi:MAG TPA: hypothetical protein VMZ53_34145 [Kofleriaceae bacterium]|nr:hypothetical protein [Kofleriaceae bacterium]
MRSWVLLVAVLPACLAFDPAEDATQESRTNSKKCKAHKKHQDCGTVTAPVSVEGGTFTADNGLTVTVPYGAVDSATTVTVSTTDIAAPGAQTPVYEFGPEGTVFAAPLTITLPLPAGVTTGTVYWTKLGSTTEYEPIGGTIDPVAHTITAQTFHFSLGYVGQPSGDRTVSGGGSRTYISATSRDDLPMDFASEDYDALVGDGSGGYARLCGRATGLGTFSIDHVPNGDYILRDGKHYLVTSSPAPDLGFVLPGRPDLVPLTTDTNLELTLTGLSPWNPGSDTELGDQIEWFSSEANVWDFNTERLTTLSGGENSVVIPINVADVDAGPASEIRSAQGHRAAAAQLTVQHAGAANTPYLAITKVAQFPPDFDVLDGSTQQRTLALQSVPTTNTLSIDYRGATWRSTLEQYGNPHHVLPSVSCPPVNCGAFVGALGQPYSANDGFYGANADLLVMFDQSGTDIVSGPMAYADTSAFQGQWGVLYDVRASQRTVHKLPNTNARVGIGRFGFIDSIEWTTTKAALEAGPILPPLLPPRNIRINGQNFFDDGGDLNGAATITWDPPASALQPAFYTINVVELYVDEDNNSHGVSVATIRTQNTSFTFPNAPSTSIGCDPSDPPAGPILKPGHAYVFSVGAAASTSGSQVDAERIASAPFKETLNIATATVSSGLFGDVQGVPFAQLVMDIENYPLGTAADASHVFWVEHGQAPWDPPTARNAGNVWMANLDGTDPRVIVSGQDLPYEIVVANNKLYWTNRGDDSDSTVMSLDLATLDPNSSTNTPTLVASDPGASDILTYGGDVYWISHAGTTRLSNGALSSVTWRAGVNFDTDGVNFYYALYGNGPPGPPTGTIESVPFAGGPVSTLVSNQPQAWDVHTDGAYIYWSNQAWEQEGLATINRIPVGGGAIQTIVTGNELMKFFTLDANNIYYVRDNAAWAVPKSGGTPHAFAYVDTYGCPQADLTVAAGSLYFTDTCGQATWRAPLP